MKVSLEGFVQESIAKKLDLNHVLVRQHEEIVGKFDWREPTGQYSFCQQKFFKYGDWNGD